MPAKAVQTSLLGVAPSLLRPGEIGVDGFCGFGGFGEGFRQAIGCSPAISVNHSDHAIAIHRLNHPDSEHFCESVYTVDIVKACHGRPVGWLHISPDCTHHSRAKGGKPRDNKLRGLCWIGTAWCQLVQARIFSLENVPEFVEYGPLLPNGLPDPAHLGESFRKFVSTLRGQGYVDVQWRTLCAADFGAPTTRERLVLIARRDGMSIRWPTPTHGKGRAQPWRTVGECIDWSQRCRSIFRAKPPAVNSQRRQAIGFVRHVLLAKRPYRVPDGAAWIIKHYTGVIGHDLRRPLGTITTWDHHALGFAHLVKYYKSGGQWQRCDEPAHTITCKARLGLCQAQVGTSWNDAVRVGRWVLRFVPDAPVRWIKFAGKLRPVCAVQLAGAVHLITDLGTRMLQPRELATAQGFPKDYVLRGTKAQQVERIGNSVPPQLAEAIVRANVESDTRSRRVFTSAESIQAALWKPKP